MTHTLLISTINWRFIRRITRCGVILFFFIFISYSNLFGQKNKFWIIFKDKGNQTISKQYVSDKTIANRTVLGIGAFHYSDVPLNKTYVDAVSKSVPIHSRSKWLNGVTASLDQKDVVTLQRLSFVSRIEPVKASFHIANLEGSKPVLDTTALDQVSASAFEDEKLTGKDIVIGIIDGNFENANTNPFLSNVFKNNRLLGTRDFIERRNVNFSNYGNQPEDNHGTLVWQLIAGRLGDVKYGLAVDASFYLARTDATDKEFRGEEDLWIAALEWMDSLGVRLINSSLGYSIDFDNPEENHKPEEMNGKGMLAKAAQIAVDEKGMIIVLAAGNDGSNKDWEITSTPADAKGVISVGGTDVYGLKLAYSAIGSPYVSYIKPNISCFSSAGTSFSAPIITGIIACMLQRDSTLQNYSITEVLQQSSHLFPYGNNYIGFGVPNSNKILMLMNKKPLISEAETINDRGRQFTLRRKTNHANPITVFHKKDKYSVLEQEFIIAKKKKLAIVKPKNCNRSTLVLTSKIIEIVWE